MRIGCIIQARMASTRLPGKVLMDIEGRPMLWHIIDRLKASKLLEAIIVATSADAKDDLIYDFCHKESLDVYRGSQDDVLDRYYRAAKSYNLDLVVRITGDCPLIDPSIVDRTIQVFLDAMPNSDVATNCIKRTYPRGLDTEVFSFSLLENMWKNAKKDYHREHVTPYIYEHLDILNISSTENKEDLSCLRWTVDEESDMEFVRQVYKKLYQDGKIFFMKDVLNLLREESHLSSINRCVKQKVAKWK